MGLNFYSLKMNTEFKGKVRVNTSRNMVLWQNLLLKLTIVFVEDFDQCILLFEFCKRFSREHY